MLPTDNLQRAFRCPRCQTKYVGSDFVDRVVPLSVVPASDQAPSPDTDRTAFDHAATIVAASPWPVTPDPVPAMRTLPIPVYAPVAPHPPPQFHHVAPPAMRPMAPPQQMVPPQLRPADHAQRAMVAMGESAFAAGSGLLTISGRLDRFLSGRRLQILGFLSLFVVVAPLIGGPWFGALSLALFLLFLCVLAVARLDSFRDDRGTWRIELVSRTMMEVAEAATEAGRRLVAAKRDETFVAVGEGFVFLALLVGAFANVVALFDLADSYEMTLCAFVALTMGSVLWVIGRRNLSRAGKALGVVLATPDAVGYAHAAVLSLPPVLDCRDTDAVQRAAQRANHPVVSSMLEELASWRPRCRYDDEREYHEKLFSLMRRRLPTADLKSEYTILPGREGGRVDMIFGDGHREIRQGILVEMKASPNGVEVDRLVGQSWKYLGIWQGRGPLVLVLCKTGDDCVDRVRGQVEMMRRSGHAVVAILAAPASRGGGRR